MPKLEPGTSPKGHVFCEEDIPSHYTKLRGDARKKWCDEQTERYKIVAFDGNTPICADEIDQRALNKLSVKAKRIAGMMMSFPEEIRREVLAAFDKDGKLAHPFKKV